MLPVLPPEIWDSIIDCLQGNYSTLMICILVCKAWQRRSLHCLPDRLDFIDRDEVMQASKDSGNLWKGPVRIDVLGSLGDGYGPVPHLNTLAALLGGRWTRVRELCISNAEWRVVDMMPHCVFLHLSAFLINSLSLKSVVFPSTSTLRQLICSLPNLKTLHCHDLSFRVIHPSPMRMGRPARITLSVLRVAGCGASTADVVNPMFTFGVVAHTMYFDRLDIAKRVLARLKDDVDGPFAECLMWEIGLGYVLVRCLCFVSSVSCRLMIR